MTDNGITRQDIITATTMTVASGGTTGIITVHRTLTSLPSCARGAKPYRRRYPCDQQEGRKVFESADSSHRSSFSIAGRWNCISSCLDPTRTVDQRAVSPLLAAATHIPAVASPTDALRVKPPADHVNSVVSRPNYAGPYPAPPAGQDRMDVRRAGFRLWLGRWRGRKYSCRPGRP